MNCEKPEASPEGVPLRAHGALLAGSCLREVQVWSPHNLPAQEFARSCRLLLRDRRSSREALLHYRLPPEKGASVQVENGGVYSVCLSTLPRSRSPRARTSSRRPILRRTISTASSLARSRSTSPTWRRRSPQKQRQISSSKLLSTVPAGGSSGALALLYLVPRAATIRAKEDFAVVVIERTSRASSCRSPRQRLPSTSSI